MSNQTPGQTNFEAYRNYRQGIAHDGSKIPDWAQLDPSVAKGWEAGAVAVLDAKRPTAEEMAVKLVNLARTLAIPDHESSIRMALRLVEIEHGASFW